MVVAENGKVSYMLITSTLGRETQFKLLSINVQVRLFPVILLPKEKLVDTNGAGEKSKSSSTA